MDPTARRTAMSRQGSSKQAHEFRCLKTAQESLAGFPEGEIKSGGDPPDCYVAVPNCGDVAFELTEQVDQVAVRAAALAKRFIEKARAEVLSQKPGVPHGVEDVVVSRRHLRNNRGGTRQHMCVGRKEGWPDRSVRVSSRRGGSQATQFRVAGARRTNMEVRYMRTGPTRGTDKNGIQQRLQVCLQASGSNRERLRQRRNVQAGGNSRENCGKGVGTEAI